jgi:class 3 adenylate cyclase/cell division protein FtsN
MTVVTAKHAPTIRLHANEHVGSGRKGLAILVAESVHSAPQGGADGETIPREAIAQHSGSIFDVIQTFQGQIVRTLAGSIMAEFDDIAVAVQAAVTMQRFQVESMHSFAEEDSNRSQPELRIGIHGASDKPQTLELFGDAAYAAARIARHAAPGQILTSRQVSNALGEESELHLQWSQKIEDEDIFEVRWTTPLTGITSRYEALFQVGAGGMGIVYKARDRETGDVVALKVLRSEIAADPAMQENLRREVRLARKVTHKNVCRIHEFNRADGTACISMEFVEGASLQSTLQRSGALSWDQAQKIALQICSGLGEAHAQGVVHRDLKPANIMIGRDAVVKIMDFGIARAVNGGAQLTSTQSGTLIGTPAYMAPEQVEGIAVDSRTDVYALGLLLYEIVTGAQAFGGDTPIAIAMKQLQEFPKRPREIVSMLPAQAENLILTCLEKDPSKRYQSMDELAMALRRSTQAKPAPALWGPFVADMRGYGRDLQAALQPRVQALGRYVRQRHWELLKDKRVQRASAIGLSSLCLLALLTLRVRGVRNHHTVDAASAAPTIPVGKTNQIAAQVLAAQSIAGSNVATPVISVDGATTSWPREVDLGSGAGAGAKSHEQSPSNDNSSKATVSTIKKVPTMVKGSAKASLARSKTMQPAVSPKTAALPAISSAASVTSGPVSNEHPAESESAESDASHLSTVAPTAPAATTAVNPPPSAASTLQARYFDVGSFKESAWADSAVEKLTQLGFHAVSVRKNLLWVQSYQVRVGPYTDPQDVENARQALIAQGFKPHAVK